MDWIILLGHRRSIRGLGRAALVSLGVLTISFSLLRLVPGDPAEILAGDSFDPQRIEYLRGLLGLTGTPVEQYVRYVEGIARGDLGTSLVGNQPVTATIARTMPVTLWLIAVTLSIAVLFSVPLAILAAIKRYSQFAIVFRVATSVALATPGFFAALILILIFAVHLRVAPVGGYNPSFPANLAYLWLPALAGCVTLVPILARVLESSITRTLGEEFVEAAVLRRVPRRRYLVHYLLRPSLAPTVGLLGYILGAALGGAAITEIVFNLPGMSSTLVHAVLIRDYPVVQGIVFVLGMVVVLTTYLADTVARWLDPRLAYNS